MTWTSTTRNKPVLTEFPFCRSLEGHPALQIIRRLAPLLDFDNGPWVAGGVIRRILTRNDHDGYDIDVFFRDEEQLKRLTPEFRRIEADIRKEHAEQKGVFHLLFQLAANAVAKAGDDHSGLKHERSNVLVPLQLVNKLFFPTVEALIEDFDFTICQMATDGRTIRCPHRSINDLAERRLRIAPTSSGVRHVSRILRYFTYGFEPDNTVLKLVESAPMGSYYDPTGGGYVPFEKLIDRLKGEDIEQQMILSRVGDMIVERDRGAGIAYIYGYPFPAPIAFIYVLCPDMRYHIAEKLYDLWTAKGLTPLDIDRPMVSPGTFLDAYRRAFNEAGEE